MDSIFVWFPETKTTEAPGLRRELKARHLTMIAIGGSIGTGLFVASGATISQAGPGGALLSYMLIGLMVYFLMTSLVNWRIYAVSVSLPLRSGTQRRGWLRSRVELPGFILGGDYMLFLTRVSVRGLGRQRDTGPGSESVVRFSATSSR